ncbi:MAG: hypothetical protein DU481_10305 [Nitrosomonas sp.]|uniref:hypothetical protein n=1 Tax=Nitrosomonas sp. TaxID=42353 RepID=UPI0032EEB962
MARQFKQQSMRNLKSPGWKAAKFTARTLDKTVSGLFRWLITDHSGISRMLTLMQGIGFWDSIKYALIRFLITIAGIVLQIVWLYFIIFHGLPLLLNI